MRFGQTLNLHQQRGPSIDEVKLLLDTYPGAEVALSLRKLRSGYSGACVRVRRSSDDAETNVGFSGDTIDDQELLDFANGGDVFVTKWFDQSGNGYAPDNSTLSEQPQIVNAGTVITENGLPAVFYNGSGDRLTDTFGSNYTGPQSIFVVLNNGATTNTHAWTNAVVLKPHGNNDESALSAGDKLTGPTNANGHHVLTGIVDASKSPGGILVQNGTETTGAQPSNTTRFNENQIAPFCHPSSDIVSVKGTAQEVIMWKADKRGVKDAIISDQNDYYGVY